MSDVTIMSEDGGIASVKVDNVVSMSEEARIASVKSDAENGKYSVLMSLYVKEHPEYLRLAIDSMLKQTAPPDEIVLVEDGPLTPELYAVLDEYPMLHRVVNEVNLGLGLALNEGLKVCRNELVARMDTDDCSKPNRCQKQLTRFAEEPDLVLLGTHVDEFVGDVTNVVSRRVVPTDNGAIREFARRRTPFNHPTVMYSRTAVLAGGGYKDIKRNEDVELFCRMVFEGYKAENIDESLLWFRSSGEQSSRRSNWETTRTYIGTIRSFWKQGYSSFTDYAVVAIAQTGMFLMPNALRDLIYKKFLRK